MKNVFVLLLCLSIFGCKNQENYQPAQDPMSAGTSFIDACLKGQFNKAEFYMVKNQANYEDLRKLKSAYEHKGADYRQQYRQTSIIIDNEEEINDSTHIIYYKNSYDKIAHKVKVLRQDNLWQVDLQYTFDGNL